VPLNINGTAGADTLRGGFGDDAIYGLAGNDTIDAGTGNDVVYGGEGGDQIVGNFGNDTLYGGAGNDNLTDDQGTNLLDGGDGNDNLMGASVTSNQTLLGGAGHDYLYATGKVVVEDGGDGNDSIIADGWISQDGYLSFVDRSSTASLIGGAGNDSLSVQRYSNVTMDGGDGNDSLTAGARTEDGFANQAVGNFTGGAGDDYLNVEFYSSASLDGGDGNDNLDVRHTRSVILNGGAGDDNLRSFTGHGSYHTDGTWTISKTATLDGGDGNDQVTFTGDITHVGSGETTVSLLGGAGNDRLTATDSHAGPTNGWGQSYGIAHATLDGGVGDDVLSAGGVVDLTMTGGSGADSFVLTAQQYRTQLEGTRSFTLESGGRQEVATHATVITDFEVGVGRDILDVSDLLRNASTGFDGSNPFSSGYLTLEQSGADTLVKFDADGLGNNKSAVAVAVLQNVTATNLVADNFNPNYPLPLNDFYNSY
jgi:Ca2+-binding RTX toxin-like protein